jgi:selenide, water dikinase
VATVDFFTPIVDDPFDFGRIAAANALSDVYAMGGRPLLALNLVAFPRALLDEGILQRILAGGASVAAEAGIAVVGGHSIDDPEPKYGLCVIGEVDPGRIVRNSTAAAGDLLVLTKPIGTGIVATAIKQGSAAEEVVRTAVDVMTTLNAGAAQAMLAGGVSAATDVTGFGLLGHLHSMLLASGQAATVHAGAVPLLPGVRELAAAGLVPGGTRRNLADLEGAVVFDPSVDDLHRTLLCDAQTSGGLLISVPEAGAAALLERLKDAGTPVAAVIGRVSDGPAGSIRVGA